MNNTAKKLGPGDDLEMINSPHLWPHFFFLPVKHKTRTNPKLYDWTLTGIILNGSPTTVLLGTLGITDWVKAERIEYASVEELLADGWIVD